MESVSVAPVEISAAAPQISAFRSIWACVLGGVLAGPGEHRRLVGGGRLVAVHRLLQPRLLFGLEQWVVVKWICVLVVTEGHRLLEPGVPFLQLEVVLNDFGENRRRLNRHRDSW